MFSVGLLESWISKDKDDTNPFIMPDLEDDPKEWKIEKVYRKRQVRDRTQYLVKWAGWFVEYNQ